MWIIYLGCATHECCNFHTAQSSEASQQTNYIQPANCQMHQVAFKKVSRFAMSFFRYWKIEVLQDHSDVSPIKTLHAKKKRKFALQTTPQRTQSNQKDTNPQSGEHWSPMAFFPIGENRTSSHQENRTLDIPVSASSFSGSYLLCTQEITTQIMQFQSLTESKVQKIMENNTLF